MEMYLEMYFATEIHVQLVENLVNISTRGRVNRNFFGSKVHL